MAAHRSLIPAALISACLVLLTFAPRSARAIALDSTAADPRHFDYAVPDAPAFQLLEVDQDAILRPGTRREIAFILDKADLKNFGLEVAPFLLARDGKVSLSDYRRQRSLFNLRLSFGARTVDEVTSAALGLRWSLLDSSDPYMNRELLAAANKAGSEIQRHRISAREDAIEHLFDPRIFDQIPADLRDSVRLVAKDPDFGPSDAFMSLPPDIREKIIASVEGEAISAAEAEFDMARTRFKNEWNRSIVEFGAALGGRGSDSLNAHARTTAYGGWFVVGHKLGGNGQIISGGTAKLTRDEATGIMKPWTGGAAARFYYGSNTVKFAGGASIGWETDGVPTYAGELLGEIGVIPSIWITPTVTLRRNEDKRPELSAKFSLRFASLGAIPFSELLRR